MQTNTNTAVIPSAPVSVDLSQNFELSLSTNEQLYHLLKDSHMANERLTARVHELERANKALVAAQKAGLASSLGVGGSDGGGSMATPGSYGAAGASPGGGGVGGGQVPRRLAKAPQRCRLCDHPYPAATQSAQLVMETKPAPRLALG